MTYPPSGNNPSSPLPGTDGSGIINGCSLPFFATANFDANPSDYQPPPWGPNNQTIEIPSAQGAEGYAWAFYGCFLNVNDASNIFGSPPGLVQPVQQWLVGAVHSCLVAQIAYSDAPIINAGGVIENPQNSDKLAQRNLQVTTSGNPGFPATHRVPQTIDVRPSPPAQSADPSSILSYPDEMMIDWGKTPLGSVASIYWPGVSAASVLKLAAGLYPAQTLTAADANTIQCQVVSPVTYIPIPAGAGGSFAGLLTVDLPDTVRYGDRVRYRRAPHHDEAGRRAAPAAAPAPAAKLRLPAAAAEAADAKKLLMWRYVTRKLPREDSGSARKHDPSGRRKPARDPEMAARPDRIPAIAGIRCCCDTSATSPAASTAWEATLLKFLRLPTVTSRLLRSPSKHRPEHCYTGKVIAVRYDRFGDFEGFTLLSEEGHEHLVPRPRTESGRACQPRLD